MSVKNRNIKVSDFKEEWITNQIDGHCIQFMEDFGYHICATYKDERGRLKSNKANAVTTSQIRNIFGEIKRLDVRLGSSNWDELEHQFLMIRPKIAYAAARVLSQKPSRNSRIKDLKIVLENAHGAVSDAVSFKRFSQLMEGIIAYHKVYGGKDN